MHPRPGPAARAKLAKARLGTVMLEVGTIKRIAEAGLLIMAAPEPSLEAAQALARQVEALDRASRGAATRPAPAGPSSTRRTRRAESAQR